jgi:hypothetical protein
LDHSSWIYVFGIDLQLFEKMSRKHLFRVASEEVKCWDKLPIGLVQAILFAFIHRITTGDTVEESFFNEQPPVLDYEI